ncbi:IS607 family transposase [Desulfoscipio gibsoniae]|uniref:Putative site-specific integrase-resolvase n=1 Tax=Desulfoscipio gibsoniae DSM 7213 TaxID=767817 RepID=R4KI88_9FIRM|nr:IS607 family transposase [Desulfoscipio gibsoniae]AGL02918.1 putative site-specific integrase-resolvase [Desulfoscipio gibsoniae DSM 7213]
MEKLLTSHQVAKLLNVWPETLRRWEKEGKLKPLRTPGGHRRYKESQIKKLLGEDQGINSTSKKCIIYARVSTAKQADAGNLQRQKERLTTYAVEKGYQVTSIYTEIASGLNENRRELTKLLKEAHKGNIDIIIIEYKDRLARFGYKYLEQYFLSHKVAIEVIETNEEKSPREELVNDMIAIVTSFSARIYGKRGGRVAKKLMETIRQEVTTGENDSNGHNPGTNP